MILNLKHGFRSNIHLQLPLLIRHVQDAWSMKLTHSVKGMSLGLSVQVNQTLLEQMNWGSSTCILRHPDRQAWPHMEGIAYQVKNVFSIERSENFYLVLCNINEML